MLLGALGLTVAVQWQYGRWLESARWLARNTSVHVLYAVPMAGLFLGCLGLSIIWPPAIVLVFLAAGAFLLMLLVSPHRRRMQTGHESMIPASRSEEERKQARRAS